MSPPFPGNERWGYSDPKAMSQTIPSLSSKNQSSGSATPISAASRRTAEHLHRLIEALVMEMQLSLRDPQHPTEEAWNRLFGPKQSMVANIQKLVAALGALRAYDPPEAQEEHRSEIPLNPAETTLFLTWIAQQKYESSKGG